MRKPALQGSEGKRKCKAAGGNEFGMLMRQQEGPMESERRVVEDEI